MSRTWKSQPLQLLLNAKLNEDNLSVLKDNLRNQIIQLCLCSCSAMWGCCRGQLGSLQVRHWTPTTQPGSWLALLCSHGTPWNSTGLAKMQSHPQFSENTKSDKIGIKNTPTLHATSHHACCSPFLLVGLLWSRESWHLSRICLGADATCPQECRDAHGAQQLPTFPLHQRLL